MDRFVGVLDREAHWKQVESKGTSGEVRKRPDVGGYRKWTEDVQVIEVDLVEEAWFQAVQRSLCGPSLGERGSCRKECFVDALIPL